MKLMRAASLALIVLIAACDYPKKYRPVPDLRGTRVLGLEVFPSAGSILEQDTLQARAYLILDNGRKEPAESVSWESLDPEILSVDPEGTVIGLKPGSGSVRARVEDLGAEASVEVLRRVDYSKIMISEVFYDATGSDEGREYIEIYNDNEYVCDITGLMIADGAASSRDFVFPQGSSIGPKSYAVIAQAIDGFTALFGKNPDYGNFSFSLNNSGETVILKKQDGSIIDAVYIKGGTEEFKPPETWGSSALPAAAAGQSVYRIDFSSVSTAAAWSSGPPTPGL